MRNVGLFSLLTIISHIIFIWISFNVIQVFDIKKIIKTDNFGKVQVLTVFVSIALGYTVSSFFLSIVSACQNLKYLFM